MAPLKPLVVLVPVVAGVATGCFHAEDERVAPPAGDPRIAHVTLATRGSADAAYVAENRLFGVRGSRPVRLAASVNANMIGTLAPVAVPDPSGAAVAYNSWRGRRPLLRVSRGPPRPDSVLDEGAHSIAWARAGRLAYFKAVRPDLGDPRRYLGHVVVRRAPGRPAAAWSLRAGRYVVAAWANGSVLAYRLRAGFPDLLVLDGRGRERVLARRSALVAVSPEGRRAFVSNYGITPPLVRILDVPTGRELARLRIARRAASYVVESGSWAGDRVFAATTTGVAVFWVRGEVIEVERVLRMERDFPAGVSEARASDDGRRVVVWGERPSQPRQAIPQSALVECDVSTFRCVQAAATSSSAPPRPVYNPSRP